MQCYRRKTAIACGFLMAVLMAAPILKREGVTLEAFLFAWSSAIIVARIIGAHASLHRPPALRAAEPLRHYHHIVEGQVVVTE